MQDWHIIECTRGRENACTARLALLGYEGGWYPVKTIDTRTAAQKKRGKKYPRKRDVAIVPGYIFIQHPDVKVHEINEYQGTLWLRVFCVQGRVVTIPDAQMAQMKILPKRLKKMMDELEEQRRLRVGGRARVVEGPLEGYEGRIEAVSSDTVTMDVGVSILGKVTVAQKLVEKVA